MRLLKVALWIGLIGIAVVAWKPNALFCAVGDFTNCFADDSEYNAKARDNEKVLAACKMKAVELYHVAVWDTGQGEAAGYLRTCMQAAGYVADWSLCKEDFGWDMSNCYQPDTPVGRRFIEFERTQTDALKASSQTHP